ncbi:CPLD36 [Auxenochlorella protothecoides x Auxenochlorella symbiontica]
MLDLAWGVNAETLAQNLFAWSIIPYAGFLYFMTKNPDVPPRMLFGWYFLLVFVVASIPAGIAAKLVYHESLSNVDYLHGGAESFLTVTNLLLVLGAKQGLDRYHATPKDLANEEDEA